MKSYLARHVSNRSWVPLCGLILIAIGFIVAVIRLHPTNYFGLTEDDSIYFSSAKALAEGKGYVLESFPGTPAVTKYPIFFPSLLSLVWRWKPSFPANLPYAIAISVSCGVLYLVAAFFALLDFKGISRAEAVLITAFCAFHPVILLYAGSVLSDLPFAALTLVGMTLADRFVRPRGSQSGVLACGVLVGLALLTRAYGVPLALGIAFTAAFRRSWRPLLVFCAAVAPFFAVLCWNTVFPHIVASPASGEAASSIGWIHTWNYYTSYANDWKQGVPDVGIFWNMLTNNFYIYLNTPAWYFLGIPFNRGFFAAAIMITVTCVSFVGIVRGQTLKTIHFVLPLYSLVVLLWNYNQCFRFLVVFLPFFAAGILLEIKYVGRMIRTSLRQALAERIVAFAMSAILFLFVLAAFRNYAGGLRSFVGSLSRDRASLLEEKRGAYAWIARSTPTNSRVLAYEDGALYLYTGRTASRPFMYPTADLYDRSRLLSDTGHLTDVAEALNAQYWLFSEDDYQMDFTEATKQSHAKLQKLEDSLPLVYESVHGRVRVRSLTCLNVAPSADCLRNSLLSSARSPEAPPVAIR